MDSAPAATHDVLNQPPPLQDYDVYGADAVLREAVARGGACSHEDELHALGRLAGSAEAIDRRLAALALPPVLLATLAPLQTWLRQLNALLSAADAAVDALAASDPVAQNLMTAPGVGPARTLP